MNEFDKMKAKKYEDRERKKRVILTGIIVCVVLIFVLAIMIIYYQKVDAHTFKLFINDGQVSSGDGFYIVEQNNETYVRARDIANYIRWSYQNGEYGTFTEDQNSGYIQNEYEVASFVAGSKILKKYIQVEVDSKNPPLDEYGQPMQVFEANSDNGTLETFTLDLPIISKNGQIYFPLRCLNDICNCSVSYDNPYRMYIYNQNYLIRLAQGKASEFGFQSLSGVYENTRALGYGMMIVSNGSSYGVVNLYTGADIIGLKYSNMVFAQNVKEFFVKIENNDEKSVGIINSAGSTIVSPKNYSNIQILSDDLGLYLVEKDEKYGVINKKGEIVVHCEYDSIGIPEDLLQEFQFSADKNKYLLFNNTLIVENNGKYGIFDIEGNQTLEVAFLGFGYLVDDETQSEIKNAEKVFTIEFKNLELKDGTTRDVNAIVIKQEIDGNMRYGLYDAVSKRLIIQCNFEKIYSKTTRGNTEYYYEFQGQTEKLADLLASSPEFFEN